MINGRKIRVFRPIAIDRRYSRRVTRRVNSSSAMKHRTPPVIRFFAWDTASAVTFWRVGPLCEVDGPKFRPNPDRTETETRSLDDHIMTFFNHYSTVLNCQTFAELPATSLYFSSRRSRQRERLHTTGVSMSICSSVCLSACLSVCLYVCRQIAKTRFSQKLSNLEPWCLLTTYIGSRTRAFQRTHYWTPKIQDGWGPPSWKST